MADTRPKLHNIEAFRKVLANYCVSPHAQQVLDNAKLVAMAGLAGGGRNTIIDRLVKKYNYFFLVSDTTRPPKLRSGVMEQDGVQYHFRNEEDLLRDLQNGEFIEAEIIHNQQVSGVSIRELERAIATNRIAISDFEYGGVDSVARAKPDAYVIALLPPTYEEWIRRFRGREVIHEQEFINRFNTAQKVLERVLEKPYFKIVINDEVERCAENVHRIVAENQYTPEEHAQGRAVAETILDKVKAALKDHRLLP